MFAEEQYHRGDDCRHAGADDADLALDAAPQRDVGVVVRRVGDLTHTGRVFQSNHAAGRDEQADEESQDDAGFTSLVLDLNRREFGNRKEEDRQVEEDVEAAVDVDGQLEVVAITFVFSVPLGPEVADGLALKAEWCVSNVSIGVHRTSLDSSNLPAVYQKAYTVGEQPSNNGPADIREPWRDRLGKDAEVKKNDGDLCDHDDELVDVLIDVKVLQLSVRCQKLLKKGL